MDIFSNIFVQLILLLIFLVFSAWFSGSETALFSLSRARLLSYKDSSNRHHKAVSKLMSSYGYTLITLIFCNMLVNTALTLTSNSLFRQHLDISPIYEQLITIVFALIVLLLFGEVAPKTIALMYSHYIADHVALPILFLRKLLFPLVWAMDKFFASILNWIGHQKPEALSSEEYSSYIEMSVAAGAFSQPERELLESVFELRQLIAEEIMVVRVNLAPLRVDTSPEAIAERIKEKKQQFYPVIKKDIDDAELLLSAKDFFLLPFNQRRDWQKRCTFPAVLIPANASLTQALKTLNKEKVPAALVVDEYGRSIGMISAKDIYTQLIGEFETIYDKGGYTIEKLSENSWIIKGMIPLFELEEALNINIPGKYESNGLNGLFSEILGRLPIAGDSLEIDGVKFVVRRVSHRFAAEIKAERFIKARGEKSK